MMKNFNPLLLMSALLAMFMATSCATKSELPSIIYEVKEYHGKDYLDHYETPDVLFHYAYISSKDKAYVGWLIDNEGNLRTYTLNYEIIDYGDPTVSLAELSNLKEKSVETGKTVDLDELVEKFKMINEIAKYTVKSAESDPAAKVNTFVYAYELALRVDNQSCANGCGGPSSESRYNEFAQVLLKSEGQNALINNSRMTQIILVWLDEVLKS